jgi:CHAT domain-containing protein
MQAQEAFTAGKTSFDPNRAGSSTGAIASLSQARDLWTQSGELEDAAAAIANLGTIHHYIGEHQAARECFETALPGLLGRGAEWIRGEALNNLGMSLWQLGEFRTALGALQESLNLLSKIGNLRGESAALNNLGIMNGELGNHQQARTFYRRALALARNLGEPISEAFVRYNLGAVYHALDDDRSAVETLESARALFQKTHQARAEGRTWLRLAEIEFTTEPRLVLPHAARAADLARPANDTRTLAGALLLQGRQYAREGAPLKAQTNYETALGIYTDLHSPAGRASVLEEIAALRTEAGQLEESARCLDEAIGIRRDLGMQDALAESWYRKALVDSKRQDWEESRRDVQAAIGAAEGVRSGSSNARDRMNYLAARRRYYGFAIGLLMQMPNEREALEISEQAKARALLESIRLPARRAEPRSARLTEAIAGWSYRLAEAHSESEASGIRRRLDGLLAELNDLESGIAPGSLAGTTSVLNAAEIQRVAAGPDTAFVEYFLGEKESWAWVVTPQSITAHRLPSQARIEGAARRLLANWSSPTANRAASDGGSAAAELLRLMWTPLPLSAARRIIISPDGVLHSVPFAALAGPRGEVVVTPSATVLAALQKRGHPPAAAKKQIAIVADPVFDAGDARLGPRTVRGASGGFPRLGFSRTEAAAIQRLFSPDESYVAMDFSASRQLLRSGQLDGYRLLHIATHAIPDESMPDLSAIVLSLRTETGAVQDGFLRLHEIAGLKLRADVVTLSGCGTGLGKNVSGEGPLSLARGFLQAGARSVVVSLWNVEDEATAALMRGFYRDLSTKSRIPLRPAESLRRAQEAVRADPRWAHPYFWAGWMVVGSRD